MRRKSGTDIKKGRQILTFDYLIVNELLKKTRKYSIAYFLLLPLINATIDSLIPSPTKGIAFTTPTTASGNIS